MNFIDAVSLVLNKPAAQLSAEELTALSEFVKHNPSIYAMAGGREAVDRYLADAATAAAGNLDELPTAIICDDEPAVLITPLPQKATAARWWLATAVVLAIALAGGIWWYSGVTRPPDQQPRQAQVIKPQRNIPEAEPAVPMPQAEARASPKSEPDSPPASVATDWEGWTVRHALKARIENQFRWDLTDPANPRPQKLLTVTGGEVEFSGEAKLDDQSWLRIVLAKLSPGSQGEIEVKLDGRPIARFPVRKADSFAVPLAGWHGKTVRLAVKYLPGKPEDAVVWDTVALVAQPSGVAWKPLRPERLESSGGAKFTVRSDASIAVDGESTEADEYLIIATLPHINIRAVKLEALGDASLPSGGPGRASNGALCVTQFSASLTERDEQHDKVTGRYVRVELPGPDRPLMMAEVEVFADGKNVALRKQTAQSSAERRSFGERAVDGNRHGAYDHYRPTTVMHTRAGLPDAWWEVDLGREYPIERITLWNRTDRLSEVMANHRVVVLDMYRKVAWQHTNPYAPMPSMVYGPFVNSRLPLEFRTAAVRTRSMLLQQPRIVRPAETGAPDVTGIQEACNFLFPLERNDDKLSKASFAGRQISFRIRHRNGDIPSAPDGAKVTGHQNLGRFRLLVTDDANATTPEPPIEVVPLLPDAPPSAKSPEDGLSESPVPPQSPRAPQTAAKKRLPNELLKNYSWDGWIVKPAEGSLATPRYLWDVKFTESPQLESRFSTSAPGATLTHVRQIEGAGAWLKLRTGQATPTSPLGQIEVRANGKPIARFEATPIEIAPERLISLQEFVGRSVKLELVHLPGSKDEAIEWDSFGFVQSPEAVGYVDWLPLTPLSASGKLRAALKILPDHSVLSEGENPPGDVYTVTTRMPPQKPTAIRLEVMPDPSLPMGGPGRGDRGGWNLGKFTAEVIDENRQPQSHTGRFVRFELVGKGRAFHLAEVEVFSAGKNAALGKPARQCSETAPGIAARAVNGVPDDQGHGGAAGFAYPGPCDDSWWEVDLQGDFPIERITIWNRQWDGRPMANHKIIILDKDRKEVWSYTNPEFPIPCETYTFPYAPRRARFTAADVTFDFRGGNAPNMLKLIYPTEEDGAPSWHSGDNPGRMQVAVFMLDPAEELSGKLVAFHLGQFRPLYYNLGRFRFSATTARGPHQARRPIVIVSRL